MPTLASCVLVSARKRALHCSLHSPLCGASDDRFKVAEAANSVLATRPLLLAVLFTELSGLLMTSSCVEFLSRLVVIPLTTPLTRQFPSMLAPFAELLGDLAFLLLAGMQHNQL